MAAANTDKWRKKKSNFSTTLSAGIDDDDVTIGLSSVSGLPTDTAIELTIDRVDANGVSTPSAVERVIGVISGSNITVALRGKDGTSAAAHDSGSVVEDIWEAHSWGDAIDSFLAGHTQAGGHATDTIAEKTAGAGVTVDGLLIKDGGITLAAAGIFKLGASFPGITDANGNELLKFTQTASAVNEITIKNEATGNAVSIEATGGDTNINLDLKGKGTGGVSPHFGTAGIADHDATGMKITLTAASNVVFGDVCYIDASGEAEIVDADAIASSSGLFMAVATIAASAAGEFLMLGTARDDTWAWTPGGLIYITVTGTSTNTLSQTAPSATDDVIQIVGVATHADRMFFFPQLVQVEHA